MLPENLKAVESALDMMMKLELAMADLYRACSEVFLVHREFWTEMHAAENKHAAHLKRVKAMLAERPGRFELGRPFKLGAIQTIIGGIRWDMERLRNRELGLRNMLYISRDLEKSMLESSYWEIIKSDDPQFLSHVAEIVEETHGHHQSLEEKISKLSPVAEAPGPRTALPLHR